MTETDAERAGRTLRWLLLLLWYTAILAAIFLFHDLPDREFRYWRL